MNDAQTVGEILDRIEAAGAELNAMPTPRLVAELEEALGHVLPVLERETLPPSVEIGRAKDWSVRALSCLLSLSVRLAIAEDVSADPDPGGHP